MLALRLSLRSARMVAFAPSASALGATFEPCYAAWVPVRGAKKGKGGGGGGGKKSRDEDAEEAVQLDQLVDMDELAVNMEKSMAHFERDLASLRVGRADPRMFDHVKVDAYGEKQPLSSVAQVNIKGAQQLAVNVFDASLVGAVANAIRDCGMQLQPQVEGNSVRIAIPKMTAETREQMVKLAGKHAEAAKQAIRKVRNDSVKNAKQAKGHVSDDDIFNLEKEIHAVYEKMSKKITDTLDKKKNDVMQA